MIWALCLNCGEVKFGAIFPCPNCQVESTRNFTLDITFSDHCLSVDSLKALGEIIKTIHKHSDDDELCFWTFLQHVSEKYVALKVNVPTELAPKVPGLLKNIELPKITVEESFKHRFLKSRG
jgi:hypothetical protein